MQDNQKNMKQGFDIDLRAKKIAKKIKELRIAAGFRSYEFFAWENHINRGQYWRVEKGANITIKTLLILLDIHKMSLAEFFKDFTREEDEANEDSQTNKAVEA